MSLNAERYGRPIETSELAIAAGLADYFAKAEDDAYLLHLLDAYYDDPEFYDDYYDDRRDDDYDYYDFMSSPSEDDYAEDHDFRDDYEYYRDY